MEIIIYKTVFTILLLLTIIPSGHTQTNILLKTDKDLSKKEYDEYITANRPKNNFGITFLGDASIVSNLAQLYFFYVKNLSLKLIMSNFALHKIVKTKIIVSKPA